MKIITKTGLSEAPQVEFSKSESLHSKHTSTSSMAEPILNKSKVSAIALESERDPFEPFEDRPSPKTNQVQAAEKDEYVKFTQISEMISSPANPFITLISLIARNVRAS